MKLRRIDIFGFKSFRERTALDVADGVTAVVGPNGCGKSNIVDAIRWALGSQSPRDLRGRAMEDVIFGGSEKHRPAGFAEVNLTFSNEDRSATGPWKELPEIRVSRRLFRTGESEYEINSQKTRLRDVQELFLGTGVSVQDGYSIIEQGRVGFIVSARPEERRALIEEAAGVTRYKFQRRTAERRLEQTAANLTRVRDVLVEIERNVKSLERQARRAARWKELSARRRTLEIASAILRLDSAAARFDEAERAVAQAREADASTTAGLSSRLATLESLKIEVFACEKKLTDLSEKAWRLRTEHEVIENSAAHQRRELDDTRQRIERMQAELAAIEERRLDLGREAADADARHDDTARELQAASTSLAAERERTAALLASDREAGEKAEHLATEVRRLAGSLAGREARLEALAAEAERLASRAGSVHEELAPLEERLGSLLEEIATATAGEEKAREHLIAAEQALADARSREKEITDALHSARREAREKGRLTSAAEARLAALEGVIARGESYDSATRALLKAAGRGDLPTVGRPLVERLDCADAEARTLLRALGDLAEAPVVEPGHVPAILEWARTQGAGVRLCVLHEPVDGHIRDGIVAREPIPGALARLLAGVDLLAENAPPGSLPAVARDGAVWHADHHVEFVAGPRAADAVLRLTRERDEAAAALTAAREASAAAEAEATRLEGALEEALAVRTRAAEQAADAAEASAAARESLRAMQSEERRLSLQAERTRSEAAATGDRLSRIAADRESLAAEQAAEQTRCDALREQLEAATAARSATAATLAAAREALQAVELQAGTLQERVRHLQEVRERLGRERGLIEDRRAELVQLATQGSDRCATLERELEVGEARRREALERLQEADRLRAEAEQEHAGAMSRLREREAALSGDRRAQEEARRALQEAEIQRERAAAEREHAREAIRDRFQVSPQEARAEVAAIALPDAVDDELAELERAITALGAVNPSAEEEYEEARERHAFLVNQQTDLESAIEDLESAIRRMDRTSRELFAETFAAVDERFREIFPRLFSGGRARLELTDPTNLLESGVEVVVQPPGKRLQSITLLSGGEKALTAVALIFSIFDLKPTPFSILDEVDAPLDEGNVGRFADLVVEMSATSQFLMITHNKRTMEAAGTLYGVTMEEPGVSKVVGVRFEHEDLESASLAP